MRAVARFSDVRLVDRIGPTVTSAGVRVTVPTLGTPGDDRRMCRHGIT